MFLNFAEHAASLAAQRGWDRHPAFHVGDRTWTHGEVHDLATRVAGVLAGHGVSRERRVVMALPDGIGWVAAFLGIARLGAVAVTVNPLLPPSDHKFVVDDTGACLVITEESLADRFEQTHRLNLEELLTRTKDARLGQLEVVGSNAPLYIQYTSGTTGRPKGVVHRHADALAYHRLVARRVLELDARDVGLSVSKLHFAYGFGNAFVFPLLSGSAAVLIPGRVGSAVVQELVKRHQVSLLYAVPSAYANLIAEADANAFRSLRAAISAGEALKPTLGERIAALVGAPVLEQLGSTEVGHAFCANRVNSNRLGTIGRPVPGYNIELRDAIGDPVPGEAQGEMWVRGPTLLAEYLNLPEATAQALVAGWLRTRDLAVRNPDGTYTHAGRIDDMEMVGGITVAPFEIEALLGQHPSVVEVAVAAVPDDRGATKLRAFVVANGEQDARQVESELIALARRHLAPFKVPRSAQLVPALPRTPTGKLRRHLLREPSYSSRPTESMPSTLPV